ncbi:hypothetical protein MAR_012017 [Mya arenaria]|uniref:C1q domain-containing protein n=1 Tax=Mya arenaria TaxID=6604 RepID=A0ABY7FVQ8_MYAAR|nr:hypothetical protein MAR_012017 [Mya arenaria]
MVRMELNVEAMHKEMQQARDQVTSDTVVAFNAHTSVDKSLAMGQVLVFCNPLFNIGEEYDNGAVIFTAPISGVYFFSAHFCLYSGRGWHYAFMEENDVVVVKAVMYYGQAGNERLWIECRSGSTDDLFFSGSARRSSFSGALLHRKQT